MVGTFAGSVNWQIQKISLGVHSCLRKTFIFNFNKKENNLMERELANKIDLLKEQAICSIGSFSLSKIMVI